MTNKREIIKIKKWNLKRKTMSPVQMMTTMLSILKLSSKSPRITKMGRMTRKHRSRTMRAVKRRIRKMKRSKLIHSQRRRKMNKRRNNSNKISRHQKISLTLREVISCSNWLRKENRKTNLRNRKRKKRINRKRSLRAKNKTKLCRMLKLPRIRLKMIKWTLMTKSMPRKLMSMN